uniref:Pentatricopeptide repeat-containing protein n=1 Tax=Rhizophora mucronata TaxID=61149 RepID=A0A2P2KG49_RHIMU
MARLKKKKMERRKRNQAEILRGTAEILKMEEKTTERCGSGNNGERKEEKLKKDKEAKHEMGEEEVEPLLSRNLNLKKNNKIVTLYFLERLKMEYRC